MLICAWTMADLRGDILCARAQFANLACIIQIAVDPANHSISRSSPAGTKRNSINTVLGILSHAADRPLVIE